MRKGEHYSKVTTKGQITLPASLREELGIEPGDVVEVRSGRGDSGRVIEVRRRPSQIEATLGIARPRAALRVTEWAEVEEVVKDEVGRRHLEEMDQ